MKVSFLKSLCALAIIGGFTQTTIAAVEQYEAVPGEYVVKLKNSKSLSSLKSLHNFATQDLRVISEKHNTVLVKREFLEKTSYALNALNNNPEVEIAEPNFIYRINRMPNDPEFGRLWGLHNTMANYEGIDIDAVRAWDIQTGSKDVIVAVIDTGVDYGIDDLTDNIWTNLAELNGETGVDDDNNGYVDDVHGYDFVNNDGDPVDDHGHGSHCSGTIGAKGNDGKGIVGVSWDVRIMGVKFLSASGSGTLENALKAIDYATVNGARILSNSWGGGGYSQTLEQAIQRSHDAGGLFVAAAGNHSANNDERPTYPANYEVDNVMSVAAIDSAGRLASFSCYGKTTVDVAAPGVDILSTTPAGYKSWSGTSMATPHVSGIAALLVANEPNITNVEIKERIIKTAKPLSGLRSKVASRGVANAFYALTDEPAPADPNDPFYWEKSAHSVETPHPYANKSKIEWEIKMPGANAISVHFKKFDTERSYDKLTVKDANGNVIEVISGLHDDEFTSPVSGDTMILEFTSDGSVNKYGIEIDQIAYK